MTLLAAWSVLLARLSGQRDVVIGAPVANRKQAEVESMIGFFVNTLALRVRLDDDPTVDELLRQVRASTLEAYANQDVPFEQVVDALKPPRSLNYSPVFQVMFSLNNTPDGGQVSLPGLTLSPVAAARTTSQFDLSLSLAETGDVIQGSLDYASDLFEAATAERFAGYFVNLLEAMLDDGGRRASELPILGQAERLRLLKEYNDTGTYYDDPALVHHLFERQARLRPEAIAVVQEDRTLSYGELNRRANRLARDLVALGVRPDDRVAICVERSIEMVVGVLGVLKAGGAYVPLDPVNPLDRLVYMLQDSAPRALLTVAELDRRLPVAAGSGLGVPVLLLDQAHDDGGSADADPVIPDLAANHSAYLIYTSGSTGLPKGVVIEHHNVRNLVHQQIEMCSITAADHVLQFASFGFDASVTEMFGTLAAGARLVLRPNDIVGPNERFVAFLNKYQVSVTELPTAFWHLWTQEIHASGSHPSTSLRLVLAGGEKAERRHLANWLGTPGLGKLEWLNTYGPTEATVNATSARFGPADTLPEGDVSIGRPIANTRIYILDPHLQPVPTGVTGEIHIGGAGVARGYLNRSELTSERFAPDPFSDREGMRMYKTGDLGRWLADGTIEYLGRNDFQVKIRGFRIELSEIEARLAQCAGVAEAVVLAREDQPGDKRLVAYLTGNPAEPAALRSELSQYLADYMVPSAFVRLERFPLTASGKLDRNAFPAPEQDAVVTRAYEAPQGDTEAILARVWTELLGLERVGRHDHFFELGGHSLLIVTLIERLRVQGLRVDVRTVFTAPTVAGMAAAIAASAATLQEFVVPPNMIPNGLGQTTSEKDDEEFEI
jgi:amino acid adenylation domain-containing protein